MIDNINTDILEIDSLVKLRLDSTLCNYFTRIAFLQLLTTLAVKITNS